MLRGSLDRTKGDPDWDLRKIEPYCGYETYDFNAIIPPFAGAPKEAVIGDNWHRFYVRMLEIIESIKIIRQGLDRYATAEGAHRIELPPDLPPGEYTLITGLYNEFNDRLRGIAPNGFSFANQAVPLEVIQLP